ncbi:MAG: SlyX family protein [Rhodobacteraceae bacterium]|jgi:SlyX protein|nr:SlyX family protein [Paracoccaceae bacterium]
MDRIETLEERIAHLMRSVEDLSEVVARQDREIATLARRVQMLMEREAERELLGGSTPEANARPPHW